MLKARILSFKYAIQGIVDLFTNTPNAKIHLLVSIFVIIAGFYFQISKTEWISIIFSIGFVLAAESLNTSIEYLTDLVTADYHELAKKTKDAAAGGVLISAVTASIIGLYIFWPYFMTLTFG